MKGELSENELRYKAEAYCSSMERCVTDVEAKLSQWGATPEVMEKIVRHLQDERYIDQKRFCSAFVRDKYRFNQWGRVKISQALRMKKIPALWAAAYIRGESALLEMLVKASAYSISFTER